MLLMLNEEHKTVFGEKPPMIGWSKARTLKGCVHYIFASLFFMSKREHLWNKEECFSFHQESSFHSRENQILVS